MSPDQYSAIERALANGVGLTNSQGHQLLLRLKDNAAEVVRLRKALSDAQRVGAA